jgi:hypothetical protein
VVGVENVGRNDVPAAVRFVESVLDEGRELDPDDGQVLLMLQDDAGAQLVPALETLYAERAAAGLKVPAYWAASGA